MSERLRHAFVLAVVTALVLVSLVIVVGIPGVVKADKTRLGIDLQGGTELIYLAHNTNGTPVNSTTLGETIDIMRSRSDTLGVSGVEIRPYGSDEVTVELPQVQNPAQAAKVVGVTGQLFFYDWEESVIGPNGKVAGPNDPNVTCDSASEAAGSAACGVTEYAAVIRASKEPAVPTCTPALVAKKAHCFNIETTNVPSYYYVDKKTQRVYAPNGPEPTKGLLDADIAHARIKLPKGTQLVAVQPGTVLVQATSAPEVPVPNDFYVLQDNVKLTGKDISSPQVITDPTQGIAVSFGFKNNGASVFQNVTAVLANRGHNNSVSLSSPNLQHFAVTLDGQLVTVPSIDFVQYPLGIDSANGSEITGGFTYATANTLANVMASGALPVKLEEISSELFTPTLGHQALSQGLTAGLIGLALVALFLLIFYRVLGMIAVSALAIYALYFYALIKLVPVTLTLPGIAGLILTIGVAADANVVIFERVKEESRAGRSPMNAITTGYRRGLSAIIDANVVTFMVAFILFILSQSDVQGFALTLGMGVLVSLFTAVAATRAILGTLGRTRAITRPSALGVTKRRRQWTFDFMGKSRWFFSLSGTILLVGALAIGGRGVNFGIDFVGGTQIQVTLAHPATVAEVSSAIESLHLKSAKASIGIPVVQQVSPPGKQKKRTYSFQIATKTLNVAQIGGPGSATNTVRGLLDARYGIVVEHVQRQLRRRELRQDGRRQRGRGDHRRAARDRGIHRAALPVEVRGAGDDRPDARPVDHGRRLRAHREAGDGRHGGGPAHHPGLLHVRHDHRVRPRPRERREDAERRLLADRQPLDVGGADAIARHEPVHAAADPRAAAVRRRDAEGLRLRDAGRRRLGCVLVDLHRLAGADALEGARAGVSPPPRPDRRRERRRRAGVRDAPAPRRARSTSTPATRRSRRRLTEPARPDGVKTSEFVEMVRDLHAEPAPRAGGEWSRRSRPPLPRPEPARDPTADARPEDVVMPPDDAAARRRGASKSRNRRRGRPR